MQEQTQMRRGVPSERDASGLPFVRCRLQQNTLPAKIHIKAGAAFAEEAVIFPTIYTFTRSAVPAVVSSVRFDAAALGTLVHHLSRLQLQALDEFFGGVPFRHGSLRERERERG